MNVNPTDDDPTPLPVDLEARPYSGPERRGFEVREEIGATTGRWRIVAPKLGRRRYDNVPVWFRTVDRFGLPTLFVVVLLSVVVWMIRADREDRAKDRDDRNVERAAFVAALKENTAAVQKNNELIRDLARKK